MLQKPPALHDIAKIKKSQIFVLFESDASYEDFVSPQVLRHVTDTLRNIFNENFI